MCKNKMAYHQFIPTSRLTHSDDFHLFIYIQTAHAFVVAVVRVIFFSFLTGREGRSVHIVLDWLTLYT